jgi:hypothetical protein
MKHPEWVGGKPPAAVRGGRWLGGCRGCVVPRLTADVSGRVEGTASGLGAVGGKTPPCIPNGWEESPQRRCVAVAGSAVAAAA